MDWFKSDNNLLQTFYSKGIQTSENKLLFYNALEGIAQSVYVQTLQ